MWQVLHDVGQALRHVHAAGLVHLDVKPANLLIGDEGERTGHHQLSAVEIHELPSRRMGVVLPSLISAAGVQVYAPSCFFNGHPQVWCVGSGCYGQVKTCCASLAARPVRVWG